MLPYPRSAFGIVCAQLYCGLVTALLGLGFCGYLITGGDPVEESKEVLSPDGKFKIVTTTTNGGAVTSSVPYEIKVQSKQGESKTIGYLSTPGVYRASWSKNNTVCIEYEDALRAQFEQRYIELDKQAITIDVVSHNSLARDRSFR